MFYLNCRHLTLFLSPARRGRGILAAQGFRPASGVTQFSGRETQKLVVNFFWNFKITFPATWGCVSDFFRMLPNFKMAARGQLQICHKLFTFYNHIPHGMELCRWFFKVMLKFNMAATDQLHIFCGRKNLKVRNYSKFYNHIPHDMEMCMWFVQGFTEIQNGRHGWIIFCGRKNSKNEVSNN